MALDAKGAAALVLHRFGLGPRAGSIDAIASDPRGALLAEIAKPGAGQIVNPELLTSAQGARLNFSFNQAEQAKRIALRVSEEQRNSCAAVVTPMEPPKVDDASMAAVPPPAEPAKPSPPAQNVNREIKARIDAALGAEIGFAERLLGVLPQPFFCHAA